MSKMKVIYLLVLLALILTVSIQSAPVEHPLVHPSTSENENMETIIRHKRNDQFWADFFRILADLAKAVGDLANSAG